MESTHAVRRYSAGGLLALAVLGLGFFVVSGSIGPAFLVLEISCVAAAIGLGLFPARTPDAQTRARRWWTPLSVLIPSLATMVGSAAAFTALRADRPLAVLVLLAGLAVTAGIGSRTYGTKTALGTAILTVGAGYIGLAFAVLFAIGTALSCESGPGASWLALGSACATATYLALGTVGFRAKRPMLGVLPAILLGVIVLGVVFAAAPMTPVPDCST